MKKYVSEFVGTLVLVLFGCGTAAVTGCSGASINAAYLLTALAFGLSIVAMAYSIGNVSGCHVNPAVSIAMLISGKMSAKDFVGYVIGQVLGGICGALILVLLIGFDKGLGCNGLFEASAVKSLLIEIILTFVFVLAILGVTSDEKYSKVAGIVIGLTLLLIHIFGIYFTGTSVNPARSFGPALVMLLSGNGAAFGVVWVFIVAPLIGGALAAYCWKAIAPAKH